MAVCSCRFLDMWLKSKIPDLIHFSKNCADIYNPFSLFNAFDAKEYKNFWFSTGTPTFLIDILQRTDFDVQSLDGLTATDEQSTTLSTLFRYFIRVAT